MSKHISSIQEKYDNVCIDKVGSRKGIGSGGWGRALSDNGFWFPDKVESKKCDSECREVGGFKRKLWENDVVKGDRIDSSQDVKGGRLKSDFSFGG